MVQKVFTREAYDKFEWAAVQPGSPFSVRQQALRHVYAKIHSQNFNEQTSAEERLAHFDIVRPTVLYRLWLRMQMSPTSSAARAVLAHLRDLAQTYSNLASQGSVAGVSLGGLLERFIVTFPQDVSRSVVGLVGGDDPRQVSSNRPVTLITENTRTTTDFSRSVGPRQVSSNCPVTVIGENIRTTTRTTVTLHMLRGTDLVSAGVTPLRDRVKKTLTDIIGPLDPGMM